MKVILIRDVKSLGKEGDLVEVSDGHARNFLFPQNLAVQATADMLKQRADRERVVKKQSHKNLSVSGDLAARLEGREFTLQEKVTDGGVLYAAVNEKAIAKALKADGFNVTAKMIKIDVPIKETGEHEVKVDLKYDFEARIKIIVESK